MLQNVYSRFAERGRPTSAPSGGNWVAPTPVSFSGCVGSTIQTSQTTNAPTPRASAEPTTNEPFADKELNPGAHFIHYDTVQQAWTKHAAGTNSGGGKLGAYRRCMGEPSQMQMQAYIRSHTSRDTRSEQVQKLRGLHRESSKQELMFDEAIVPRELQATPPLSTNCTWQTFRSNKVFPPSPNPICVSLFQPLPPTPPPPPWHWEPAF